MRAIRRVERTIVRSAASLLSRGGRSGSLLVLIYHRVLPAPDPLLPDEPDAARFAREMDWIGSCFNVLPLSEAVARLVAHELPPRAVCITFDDGYANNHDVAMPILLARRLPATVFVAPAFLDGGRMFNDTVIETVRRAPVEFDVSSEQLGLRNLSEASERRRLVDDLLRALKYLPPEERLRRIDRLASTVPAGLPDNLMMTRDQVRSMHQSGIAIGAHTLDHPILTSVDDGTARQQIEASKAELEVITGAPVTLFAYPNGRPGRDYAQRHVRMVREAGFVAAVSTAWGAATTRNDPYQIPRIAAWDRTPLRYGLRLARSFGERRPAVA